MKYPTFKTMTGIKENYIKKIYPKYYNILCDLYPNKSFSEKVWLYQHNLKESPICPNCDNRLKYRNFTIGYFKYCSKSCAAEYSHKNPDIKQKRIQKMMECNNNSKTRKIMTENANITKSLFSLDKKKNINNKRKNTCIEKYGVDIVSKNIKIKEKVKNKTIITKEKNKITNFIKRINLIGYNFISSDQDKLTLRCNSCGHEFDTYKSLFNQRNRLGITVCTVCNPLNNHISDFQNKVKRFISTLYEGEIIDNAFFEKYEIDIYLPELNLGFECNGLWWHSEVYKEKEYHINKYEFFKNKNIKIINIWEDWWNYKTEIIKSIISYKLDKITNIIYAKNTNIKEISNINDIKNFLNNNHIQGYVQSKIKLGLYKNEELISLMTFKKLNENKFELIRFCNKLNLIITDGEYKLFNYFIDNYKPSEIITYADLSIFDDNLYKKLNMTYINRTEPNYTYFNKDKGIRLNRFNFRKDILVKNGYNSNKTAHDIMKDRGYYKIYDSGNLKFKYFK
jgi:hypothetical protein